MSVKWKSLHHLSPFWSHDIKDSEWQQEVNKGEHYPELELQPRCCPHKYAFWAIKESSSGNKNIDEAVAIKLVWCNAVEKQWSSQQRTSETA